MNPKELVEMMYDITEKGKEKLYFFIENAKKLSHKDRGIEGWFQTELIAELKKRSKTKDKTIEHTTRGPDLKLPDGKEIELKMTTCFNPEWTINGMIKHEAPVLFFSGYLDYKNKKNPDFEDEDAVKKWFQEKLDKKSYGDGFSIMYKTVDLVEDKGIVGIIEPSKEMSCVKI